MNKFSLEFNRLTPVYGDYFVSGHYRARSISSVWWMTGCGSSEAPSGDAADAEIETFPYNTAEISDR